LPARSIPLFNGSLGKLNRHVRGTPAGVNITGGTLQGGGALPVGSTITGSVSLGSASGAAGTFIIGDSVKKSGLLAIANNYVQLATGAMDVQVGGTTPGTR